MFFSRPTTYAVRALTYLASHSDDGPILSAAIAREENIPGSYLIKVLGTLSFHGYVRSVRGPGGGFSLNCKPEEIRLLDIYSLFDTVSLSHQCLMRHGDCNGDPDCPVHRHWQPAHDSLMSFLRDLSVQDLLKHGQA